MSRLIYLSVCLIFALRLKSNNRIEWKSKSRRFELLSRSPFVWKEGWGDGSPHARSSPLRLCVEIDPRVYIRDRNPRHPRSVRTLYPLWRGKGAPGPISENLPHRPACMASRRLFLSATAFSACLISGWPSQVSRS